MNMMSAIHCKRLGLCAIVAGMASVGSLPGLAADYVPEPQPCASEPIVGCFYFPGHFNPLRWTPMQEAQFPLPLLGYYRDGEPEVSDWHIKWAVEHGIDFFAFDWYCHYKNGPGLEHNKALDQGFLSAQYRGLMQFCLMWCNEGKEERYTEEHMLNLARILTDQYFSQPNHLRIDGDNVLIVSVPRHFLASFGEEGTAAMFEKMAQVSREAGHGGLFPVAKGHHDQAKLKRAGFRATTAYNYPHAGMTPEQEENKQAPYDQMVRGYEETWKSVTEDGALPYIVPVSPGWDSRPWYREEALVRTHSRPRLYYEMCEAAKQYIDPKLNMVLAECWNEFGEGSYIEPTIQYGFGFLDAMRDAFCPENPHHDDIIPASIGRQAPIFADVPPPVEEFMARCGNMLYNSDMEGDWGWAHFNEQPAVMDKDGYEGQCLLVPQGQGVKTIWRMPIPESKRVGISLWNRVPEKATVHVQAALFRGERWLGRYMPVATLQSTGDEWRQFQKEIAFEDAEADRFNLEFRADDGSGRIDEITILAK